MSRARRWSAVGASSPGAPGSTPVDGRRGGGSSVLELGPGRADPDPIPASATVAVTGSARTDVRVRIVRRAADGASLGRLEERIELGPSGLQVSVLQTDSGRDARLTSTVVVEVPGAQPIAMIELFEGTARVRGVSAGASVRVTRGAIDATDVSGPLRFETTMGIGVRWRHAPARRRHSGCAPSTADIDLTLPAPPANARILALAMNGTPGARLRLTTRTTVGPRFSEATFGNGAPVLNLDAVNGDIRLATARR